MEKSLMMGPKTALPAASFAGIGFRCAGLSGGSCARSDRTGMTSASPTPSAAIDRRNQCLRSLRCCELAIGISLERDKAREPIAREAGLYHRAIGCAQYFAT